MLGATVHRSYYETGGTDGDVPIIAVTERATRMYRQRAL